MNYFNSIKSFYWLYVFFSLIALGGSLAATIECSVLFFKGISAVGLKNIIKKRLAHLIALALVYL